MLPYYFSLAKFGSGNEYKHDSGAILHQLKYQLHMHTISTKYTYTHKGKTILHQKHNFKNASIFFSSNKNIL